MKYSIYYNSLTGNTEFIANKINEMFKYESMMREKEYTKIQIETYRNGEEYQKNN